MEAYNDANDLVLSDEVMEETEQQTQSTQQASQPSTIGLDAHLWGYLQPCSASLTRIDFWKINPRYTLGRNTEQNQVVLPGLKISKYNHHLYLVQIYMLIGAQVTYTAPSHGTAQRTTVVSSSSTSPAMAHS